MKNAERDAEIRRLVEGGMRHKDVAKRFGISPGRVSQICNPLKTKARLAAQCAVRKGVLVAPDCCERCGASGSLNKHHADYSKPLDVEWLCHPCHGEEHSRPRAKQPNADGVMQPEPLSERVTWAVTPEENTAIRWVAEKRGIPVSEVMRTTLIRESVAEWRRSKAA